MSLLDHDQKLVKEVGLTLDLSKEDKIKFIDAQIEGISSNIWRSRVDAILNRNLKPKNEDEEVAVAAKIREHENDVRRFAEALTLLDGLRQEVSAQK